MNDLLASTICFFAFLGSTAATTGCSRPSVGDNVILSPDSQTYAPWTMVSLSCAPGYISTGGQTYSYCYSSTTYYWYPSESDMLSCVQETSTDTVTVGDTTEEESIYGDDILLVAEDTKIVAANLAGADLYSLVFNDLPISSFTESYVIALAYHPAYRTVFWTELNGAIKRAGIDGSNYISLRGYTGRSEGLAIDLEADKLYWTDTNLDKIFRANLDGTTQEEIINTDLDSPRAIVIHQEERIMFWTDWGAVDKIERSNLDGSERMVIVNSTLLYNNGLTISGSRLYWCDAYYDTIESSNFWGGGRTVVLSIPGAHPFDLAIVDDVIIWTDWQNVSLGIEKESGTYGYYYGEEFDRPNGIVAYRDVAVTETPPFTDDDVITDDGATDRLPTTPLLFITGDPGSTVRLVNGSSSSQGRVEVYYDGVWGTVCDDGWDYYNARVVCRSLGFDGVSDYIHYFGEGTGPIYLDNVNCYGYEDSIFDCPHNGIGNHNCGHYEDVGVRCYSYDGFTDLLTTAEGTHELTTSFEATTGIGSCEGSCCVNSSASCYSRSCYCDRVCVRYGDCCPDFNDVCDYAASTVQGDTTPHEDFTDRFTVTGSPDNDIVCGSTSMTLYVDRSLLDSQDGPSDIHFIDDNCVGYYHDYQHVAITTRYDRCGTIQEQEADHIVFYNKVTYYTPRDRSGTNQIITREHILHINVTCKLEREETLSESFYPIRDAITASEVGYGEFTITMERYTDSTFNWQADDSALVVLGQELFFGVKLVAYTDLTLFIDSCWATRTPNPLDTTRYSLIEDGCAEDTTVTFRNMGQLFKGFTVDAFTFIGDYEQVFVHCDILVCDNGEWNSRCFQGCVSRARRDVRSTGSQSNPHTVSLGPLSVAEAEAGKSHGAADTSASSFNYLVVAAIGSVGIFIALIVVVGLVVSKRMRARPESLGYRQVNVALPEDE